MPELKPCIPDDTLPLNGVSVKARLASMISTIKNARAAAPAVNSAFSPLALSLAAARARGYTLAQPPVDKSFVSVNFAEIIRGAQATGEYLSVELASPGPVYAVGRGSSRIFTSFAGKTVGGIDASSAQRALNFKFAVLVEYTDAGGKKAYLLQETAAQLTGELDANKPIEAAGGVQRGNGYSVRVALLERNRILNPFNRIDWAEYINGIVPSQTSMSVSYNTNVARPYGPYWVATRPPGTPANLRFTSSAVSGSFPAYGFPADMLKHATTKHSPPATLYYGEAHREYDNRPEEGRGGAGLVDPGPFGAERGGNIEGGSRAAGGARIDRFGVVKWTAAEWSSFSQGFSLPYYTTDPNNMAPAEFTFSAGSAVQLTYAYEVPYDLEVKAATCRAMLAEYMSNTLTEPVFQSITLAVFTASFTVFKRVLGAFALGGATDTADKRVKYAGRNSKLLDLYVNRALDTTAEPGVDVAALLISGMSYTLTRSWSPNQAPPAARGVGYGQQGSNTPPSGSIVGGPSPSTWHAYQSAYTYKNGWEQGVTSFPPAQTGQRGVPVGVIVLHWGGETRAKVLGSLGTTKSTHYTVDSSGEVHQHAYIEDATWHAGVQNAWSIGIDLCTPGLIPIGQERAPRFSGFEAKSFPVLGRQHKYALARVAMYESTHQLVETLRTLYTIRDDLLGVVRDVSDGALYVVMRGGHYLAEEHASKWYGVTPHMMLALDDQNRPARVDEVFMFVYHCLRRQGNTAADAYINAIRTLEQTVLPATPTLPPRVKLLTT